MKKKIICPVCNSSESILLATVQDLEYWTSSDLFSYFLCSICNSIFLKNPPIDRLSEIYPDTYYSTNFNSPNFLTLAYYLNATKNYLDKIYFRKLLKKISFNSDLSCLDIGGGSGWLLNVLRQSDSRIKSTSVLDINPKSRAIAEDAGHKFYCQTIESFDLKDSYDIVLLLNLIEHVADPRKVLSIIHKSMKKNGILIVKTPNTLSWNRLLFANRYWGGYHAPRHWIIFNEKSFTRLSKKMGFIVESLTYTQGAAQWAASIYGSFFPNAHRKTLMHHRPFFNLLILIFAFLDFIFLPFLRTDQMFVVLRKF